MKGTGITVLLTGRNQGAVATMTGTLVPKLSVVASLCLLVLSPFCHAEYKTENVIIAIMDGTHYDRTFGDPSHELIPHLWNDLAPQGTHYTNFYNNSVTITLAGHSNIMTGAWHYTRNRGPLQTRPTVIHYMADELKLEPGDAWVVFGKGFYAYHPETSFPGYSGLYEPGFAVGLGESSYRGDQQVLSKAIEVMNSDRPRMMLLNFGATDHTAHSGNWEDHIGAVRNCDLMLYQLWQHVQSNPHYKDKTTLIITSDHGYMDVGVHDGFAEHGDASKGSRHVFLVMLGPDTKKGHVVTDFAYHVDIAPTVGELLGFQTPLSSGQVLSDSLRDYQEQNRKQAVTPLARKAVSLEQTAQDDLVGELAGRILQKYGQNGAALTLSIDTTVLLWGMLAAYDRTGDSRYLGFVEDWSDRWGSSRGEDVLYSGFVEAMLAFRTADYVRRSALIGSARRLADPALKRFEQDRGSVVQGDKDFLLSLIFASAVSELSRDEELWHRAADLYIDHVRRIDFQKSRDEVRAVRADDDIFSDKDGEVVQSSGKVLPDATHRNASPDEPWYLLTAVLIRGHGLPYKGENLPDLPFFRAEVLYRTALMLEKLSWPGDIWDDPLDSALTIAALREAQRRVTYRGAIYESVDSLNQFDLGTLRPESAEAMPRAEHVKELIRTRITQLNYNVQYGYPPYKDFDFTADLLRLYSDQANSDMSVGAFLLALDPYRRVPIVPFVPSPR